jgi:hypothetical protein
MQHVQSAAMPCQERVNLGETLPDKLDAAIGFVLKRIKDFRVEHENTKNASCVRQRTVKRVVIYEAQIPAHP